MARRWVARGLSWIGFALGSLIALVLLFVLLVTQTAYGRERVRQLVIRLANQQLAGSLYVGALRFGPGCALSIDSAVIRDPDDAQVLALGPVRATCRFDALVRGQLILTSLDIARPNVVVRQSSGGTWNWSRIARNDTTAEVPVPDSLAAPGTTRLIVNGPIRISDASVALEVPGMPRRVLSGFTLDAPLVKFSLPDLTTEVDLKQLSGTLSDPLLTLHQLSGSLSMVGDSAAIDLPFISAAQSTMHLRGWIDWGRPGTPAMSFQVVADTLSFADLSWLAREIPTDGGGRFEASVIGGGGKPLVIAARGVDLRTMRSQLQGSFSVRIDSASPVIITEANIDATPVRTELVRRLAPDVLPPSVTGALSARVRAHGNAGQPLRVETLDARYVDERDGAVSRISANGDVDLDNGSSSARLNVTVHELDARTLTPFVPSLTLQGKVRGTMRAHVTPSELRIEKADLRYAEGDSTLRLTGGGRITLGSTVGFDLKLDGQPLAPSALAESFPSLANLRSFEGPIEIRGTADDMSITAGLKNPGGSIALAARYRSGVAGISINGTVRVRDLDPQRLGGDAVPPGKVDADITVDLKGDSLTDLRGTAEVSQLAGVVGGLAIEPSYAKLTLTDSRIVADSVILSTSAGPVHASGAIGRDADSRDTLVVATTMSLEALRPLLRSLLVSDSIASDTVSSMLDSTSGNVTANVRLIGSVDSLAVEADLEGQRIAVPSARASRLNGTAALTVLPGAPRGHVTLRADSLLLGSTVITSLTTSATSRGSEWLVRLATSPDDATGGEAIATVASRADTLDVAVDSLLVRVPGTSLRLTRPTRFHRNGSGTMVLDTTELRGERGSVFQAAAMVRDTGAIAAFVQASNVPLNLPGLTGTDDSLRAHIDGRAELVGTAKEPRATLRARVKLLNTDSLSLDSVLAEAVHERGGTRIRLTAHVDDRSFFVAEAQLPVNLSLSPFTAEVREDSISGDIRIDSVPLANLARLMPGVRATSGTLRANLALSGTLKHPQAIGAAELRDGAAHIAALGITVRGANAKIDITHERLTVSQLSVRAGEKPEGRLEVTGFVGLGDSARSDLAVRSSYMPVMRLAELGDLDVSSNLRLAGPSGRPTLSGSITVDRGVIRLPEMGNAGVVGIDDTAFVRLVDSLAPARGVRPPGMSSVERLEIGQIQVIMGPNVWLRSTEASIQIGGRIGLERYTPASTDSAPRMALRGSLTTQRGNYRFSVGHISRLFELEEGAVTFNGEPELNPRLDINALYEREGYDASQGSASSPRVRLHVGGTLERPSLTFASADAKLSQSELMSYLITGQTHFAVGDVKEGAVSSELVASATGALAQRVAGGVFDVVNVTAGSTNSNSNSSRGTAANVFATSRLGVGKQVSNRVFLKVDAGLCALAGGNGSNDLWQSFGVSLDYRFRQGLLGSLSSAPSTNGANCSNQAAGRGTALAPRQWGFDFNRTWRF